MPCRVAVPLDPMLSEILVEEKGNKNKKTNKHEPFERVTSYVRAASVLIFSPQETQQN